ncbi:MAG: FeoB-associated Cys-rich membrane protein [Oscillospiraceae bacterium]|nr:FeoB-associated Cys-rich membrane protein [Oscillospiraceae bacterium]
MLAWLRENAGTLAVLLVLLVILAAIVVYLIREKRSGRSSCGNNCAGCAMRGSCRGDREHDNVSPMDS